ncbi:hypothetical protein CLD22_00035 [Rubrivivax gelatinosus]|nr:hypothetical protein [Rubrivivax gelatinosus]
MDQIKLKALVKAIVARSTAAIVPHGMNLYADLRRCFPDQAFRTIFDVGANVGQTALVLARLFPEARIHSFEPFADAHRQLIARTRSLNVICHASALGEVDARITAHAQGASTTNTLLAAGPCDGEQTGAQFIDVLTLDGFCAAADIKTIELMKIDTEGFDLKVLHGAARLLGTQAVKVVQVEASMNATNSKHVPFAAFVDYFDRMDYRLFGVYEQTREWSGEARLRFANPVFVCRDWADRKIRRSSAAGTRAH